MTEPETRSSFWKWWVCGLLLCATMINYMDRMILANLSVRVTRALSMTNEQYGTVESSFSLGFAAGSLLFGFLADRFNVRLLYPAVLVCWSGVGILTGFAQNYDHLHFCRTLLGLFEAGHWPCALVTTQRLLSQKDRAMGNSVLQSGAAIGAIITPPIVLGILHWFDPGEAIRSAHLALGGGLAFSAAGAEPDVWQIPFVVIGIIGLFWVLAWFLLVPRGSLNAIPSKDTKEKSTLLSALLDRRFFVLFIMVTCINSTWQLVRAWLPKFLMQGRGYTEADALWFNSAYFIAADIGCILAGVGTLWFARHGLEIHKARIRVYFLCACATALTVVAAGMPAGWPLLAVLLVVAAGSLGLFPCYYSFTQEITRTHMGRISGILGASAWVVTAPLHIWFGAEVDRTKSFDMGILLAGLPPLVALVVLLLLWRGKK